jgi:MFS transporter, DHA1 family, tetracycline resistance protein
VPESLAKENRREFSFKKSNPISSFASFKDYSSLYGLFLTLLLLNIAHQAVRTTWSFYVIEKFHWSEQVIGYSLATIGIMYALVQAGLIGFVLKIFGEKGTLYFGFIFYIIGNVLFGLANTTTMMFLSIIPYCLGGVDEPALQGIMTKEVSASEQGKLQGLIMSIISISSIIGHPLMTEIFSYSTRPNGNFYLPSSSLYISAIITFVCLIISYLSLKKMNSSN